MCLGLGFAHWAQGCARTNVLFERSEEHEQVPVAAVLVGVSRRFEPPPVRAVIQRGRRHGAGGHVSLKIRLLRALLRLTRRLCSWKASALYELLNGLFHLLVLELIELLLEFRMELGNRYLGPGEFLSDLVE